MVYKRKVIMNPISTWRRNHAGKRITNLPTPTTTELVAHLECHSEKIRRSFGRQLHDDLGGLLISALMDLTPADEGSALNPVFIQRQLTRARHALLGAVHLERQLVDALRPTLLDHVGLFAALSWHTRVTCQLADIGFMIDMPSEEPAFFAGASILLFRIVEEGLTSLLLDKSVTCAELTVTISDKVMMLRVLSNGTSAADGKDEDEIFSSLRLQHRVGTLGGDLCFTGPAAGGTSITARFACRNVIH